MIAAILALALGVLADLIRINRVLIEDTLEQQKRQRFAREGDMTVRQPGSSLEVGREASPR